MKMVNKRIVKAITPMPMYRLMDFYSKIFRFVYFLFFQYSLQCKTVLFLGISFVANIVIIIRRKKIFFGKTLENLTPHIVKSQTVTSFSPTQTLLMGEPITFQNQILFWRKYYKAFNLFSQLVDKNNSSLAVRGGHWMTTFLLCFIQFII